MEKSKTNIKNLRNHTYVRDNIEFKPKRKYDYSNFNTYSESFVQKNRTLIEIYNNPRLLKFVRPKCLYCNEKIIGDPISMWNKKYCSMMCYRKMVELKLELEGGL